MCLKSHVQERLHGLGHVWSRLVTKSHLISLHPSRARTTFLSGQLSNRFVLCGCQRQTILFHPPAIPSTSISSLPSICLHHHHNRQHLVIFLQLVIAIQKAHHRQSYSFPFSRSRFNFLRFFSFYPLQTASSKFAETQRLSCFLFFVDHWIIL